MSSKTVRVRFAPSPTGALHIGGLRTALFNYLFAKKNGGQFLLRIEDTDQTRFVAGAEEYILNSLEWLGITIDEGIKNGGPHAPYRQSERKPMYRQYAEQLVEKGLAYYAFDTEEELDAMRKRLEAAGVASPQYNAITRQQMKNSLTLPEDEVKAKLSSGEPYVIRLKVPRKEEIRINDLIRGWVMVHSSALDDKVLLKSDGMPTYHLANVVDDHLMEITHVIRGEEWLPSTPIHVLLYQFLGWEQPYFAHLPLLLKPVGEGKLSKRDGKEFGFPVFPMEWHEKDANGNSITFEGFKESGYFPEALANFLALLGWNPGTPQEIFSMEELCQQFSLERINKSGIRFNIEKAKWYNQQYLRAKSDKELAGYLLAILKEKNIACSLEKATEICALTKERAYFPQDLYEEGKFIFEAPSSYDEEVLTKKWNEQVASLLQNYCVQLKNIELTPETAKSTLNEVAQAAGMKIGAAMQPLRVALTGKAAGPDLMQLITILGADECEKRILVLVNYMKEKV
jgi:glutamyl-tRNA synthetase